MRRPSVGLRLLLFPFHLGLIFVVVSVRLLLVLPVLAATVLLVRVRLSQQESLQDEILAMGVLALDLQKAVVVDGPRLGVAAIAGRRSGHGQVRRQLLQVRIACDNRNALLGPQVEPE